MKKFFVLVLLIFSLFIAGCNLSTSPKDPGNDPEIENPGESEDPITPSDPDHGDTGAPGENPSEPDDNINPDEPEQNVNPGYPDSGAGEEPGIPDVVYPNYNKKQKVYLGIDNIDDNLDIFEGKKVGLITNPTGVNSDYRSTIDVLYEKVNLTALFAPEHGIRGNSQAGGSVGNEVDEITGLTVYSLYGSTKKPTAAMLSNVDVLCIDIQDVGARFYTYIYTMAYAMEACKEFGKTFVVFDRPNPIGGKVEGTILEEKNSSFIGLYPIITRHGMTIGELAMYFNTEFNINCDLKVVEMTNYNHDLYMDETTVPWINPSPNMPTLDTALVYTGTGNFEGLDMSEGRGTTKPFEFIGAPYINPFEWAEELNSLGLEGVYFRPMYFTPTFEDYANKLCGGVQVHVLDRDAFSATKVGVAMVYTVKKLYPYSVQLQSYLKLVTGVDYIYNMTYTMEQVFDLMDKDAETFSATRAKYLIYN